ncbi:3-hydroxybutyryl-CoA dehydrogenase [Paenibacillus rhizovicinus]|uniref:3-hydroxybutyryl-CoA dehydrogenase n=1 Tax=Paenibacillus rhizovicinus TaxID=2704463 RepID=A0A6C0NYN4_9BACL|nr:3-hydroxybutyryl-CoA dehydrogenase [Paenibacillus rhizovicinus]QHW31309.1 3-hydroxybutyryl-CoA dehydrogenase [Paenibacillus rhizovicinus]
MTIQNVSVVGAGQMGRGIAQVAALAGCRVLLHDTDDARVSAALDAIGKALASGTAKGRLAPEAAATAFARIVPCGNLSAAAEAELVIEAATENMAVKKKIFGVLDGICGDRTILASNTSSLSLTELAAATTRPERVIGMHFMNPVPVMKLVEIIRGLRTSDETYDEVAELAGRMGKTALEVRDFPGFVSNRILMPMINEAVYAVYEGVATAETVDGIMELGMNHPMGPLALADLIGLDTCLAIMETLHEGFGDSKYRPCPLLRSYVHAGWLGRKSGRGFYVYGDGEGS